MNSSASRVNITCIMFSLIDGDVNFYLKMHVVSNCLFIICVKQIIMHHGPILKCYQHIKYILTNVNSPDPLNILLFFYPILIKIFPFQNPSVPWRGGPFFSLLIGHC